MLYAPRLLHMGYFHTKIEIIAVYIVNDIEHARIH